MKVFLPSWNGDFRLVGSSTRGCKLSMEDPTLAERETIGRFLVVAKRNGWVSEAPEKGRPWNGTAQEIALGCPVQDASKVLIRIARPKDRTLTAVAISGEAMSITEGASAEALRKIEADIARGARVEREGGTAVAASVKRPTPSCPQCMPGAVGPATEVLLSFLDEEEHRTWSKGRFIVIEGGFTGTRYLLAHRNSSIARRVGRICYDLDAGKVVHFHDWSVPPEEEVLAAKLVLEYREDWLRNEATCFEGARTEVFKNPFGGFFDGVESAQFAEGIGRAINNLPRLLERLVGRID